MIRFILSALSFYFTTRLFANYAQPIRDDGPRQHLKKAATPTMGGAIIILGALYQLYYLDLLLHPVTQALVMFGFIGLYDDLKKLFYKNSRGLSAKVKFILQWVAALVIVLQLPALGEVSLFGYIIDIGPIYILFASFVIVATSNAYNLVDGIDGLAASQGLLLLFFFGAFSMAKQDLQLVHESMVLIVMLAGFLLFNFHPAKLFMGDVGALSLGAALGVFAVMLKIEFLFAATALILVIETCSVILQVTLFKMGKGRLFKMAPYHHHLELSGWSENQIVCLFSFVTIILIAFSGLIYGL